MTVKKVYSNALFCDCEITFVKRKRGETADTSLQNCIDE